MNAKTKFVLATLVIGALLVAATYFFPAREVAIDLIEQVRSYGPSAPVVYFLLHLVASIGGVSRTILTIVAGILFEPVIAFVVVTGSMMIAFMATFMAARYFVADWVQAKLDKTPAARQLMSAVEENSFRMLVLMRLNPFIPGIVNGYGFGLTSMKPMTYFLASVVGSLPLNLIYIYLGWAGGTAILRSGAETTNLQTGTIWFGAIVSVVMLVAITWYGRRAIAATGNNE